MCFVLCLCLCLLATLPGFSQDIEPRRWSHLPLGSSFGGLAYAYRCGAHPREMVDGTFHLGEFLHGQRRFFQRQTA
jgi:hypothetical protein